MIYSDVKFGDDAINKILAGAKVMGEAVGSTFGPMGRNVAIANASMYGEIWRRFVVHDGVTVANSIFLQDEHEDFGAQMIRQASQKTVDAVGDGTTVSAILSLAIVEEIHKLHAAGVNPMKLRKHIEKDVKRLIEEIEKISTKIEKFDQLKQIATISAQDDELGEMVAKVVYELGPEGLIVPEESKNNETVVEQQKGMQIDKGWLNPFFMTRPDRNEATLEEPLILITDKSITSLAPLKHILEYCNTNNRKLFVMTPHMSEEAMGYMIDNKRRNVVYSLVVSAPSFGQDQKNKLQDIAIYTGARYISEDSKDKFESINIETDLGTCEHITANKTETIIVGGKGKKEAIDIRVKEIQTALKNESVLFDQEKMKERIAKFTTGVAVIKVGGATEVEMKERMERVKDAVAAAKSAKKHGIVPGAAMSFLMARKILKNNPSDEVAQMASSLLWRALYKPFAKLLQNAGMNDGEWYAKLEMIVPENSEGFNSENAGVNVVTEEIVDLIKAGIIDPVSVPVEALRNAASTAIQISTIGVEIIQKMDWKTERPKP